MSDKGNKGWVMDRPAGLPSKHNRLLAVIKALFGDTPKIGKGILMSPDQGVEIPMKGKVNIMSPGKTRDVRETQNLAFACAGKFNGVRTPIHLPLTAGLCLKSDYRLSLGPWAYLLQPIS